MRTIVVHVCQVGEVVHVTGGNVSRRLGAGIIAGCWIRFSVNTMLYSDLGLDLDHQAVEYCVRTAHLLQ